MIARRQPSNDRGFSLIEVLVSVVIIGITFVVFVAGIGSAIVGTEYHRKQAVSQAGIRNFAEAVKAAPFNTNCTAGAAAAAYNGAYSPPPPPRQVSASVGASSTSQLAPALVPDVERERLLTFVAAAFGTSANFPTVTTKRWEQLSLSTSDAARVAIAMGDQTLTGTSNTGTRLVTLGTAAPAIAQSVLLPPTSGIQLRGVEKAGVTNKSTMTLARPASTVPGDALIAQIAFRGAAVDVFPPAGWTLVNSTTDGVSITSNIYERVVASTPAANFVWSFGAAVEASGAIVGYGGVGQEFVSAVTDVHYWDSAAKDFFPVSAAHPCPSPATQAVQKVFLELTAADGKSKQTVQIIKRCNVKPSETTPCGDV